MEIWQNKGCLTTQWKDNNVTEHVWEIAQSMSITNRQGAGPEHWDLLIDCCVTSISDLLSNRPLSTQSLADKSNLDGQKLKAALDKLADVGLRQRKNRIDETQTKKRKFVYVGMYFITLMLLLLFLIMCGYRRR